MPRLASSSSYRLSPSGPLWHVLDPGTLRGGGYRKPSAFTTMKALGTRILAMGISGASSSSRPRIEASEDGRTVVLTWTRPVSSCTGHGSSTEGTATVGMSGGRRVLAAFTSRVRFMPWRVWLRLDRWRGFP